MKIQEKQKNNEQARKEIIRKRIRQNRSGTKTIQKDQTETVRKTALRTRKSDRT